MDGWGRVWCLVVAAALSGCSTTATLPVPTPQRPAMGCQIVCPDGFFSRVNHLCKSGKRHFIDHSLIGENIVRNVDGTKKVNDWIVRVAYDGHEYVPKVDVVRMSCSAYIASVIQARDPGMRGVHPGETPDGKPIF